MPKILRNPRWLPMYIKIDIFTNNFATTYARVINEMSILMFSGLKKTFLWFVYREKYCKVYIYANISKNNPISRLTLFWLIVFFSFDYAWLVLLWWYLGGCGAHILVDFCKHEIQNGCHESSEVIFWATNPTIFIRNYNEANPTIIRHRHNTWNATISFNVYIPK